MSERPCRHCGMTLAEHHEFDPIELPKGCVCYGREWGCWPDPPPPPCSSYEANPKRNYCASCDHDRECHGVSE